MKNFSDFIAEISSWLWGYPLLILLFGTHIFLTFRLGFIQRHLGKAIRLSVTRDKESQGDVSQFSALATALAATIGTGNIVGVATAIELGGPGAILWTWIAGILGISTKYAEGLLALKYRVKRSDGSIAGGPMYYLHYGLKNKKAGKILGILFAVFAAMAAFGLGSSAQSNSIKDAVFTTFGFAEETNIFGLIVPTKILIGIVLAFFVGLVIVGGIKSIARVSQNVVPFMACFYVAGCLWILIAGYETLWDSIKVIFSQAFSVEAVGGGAAGSVIMLAARYGVSRGLFSNESGLGSAAIVAAAARTRNPVRQALVSSSGTFWDTVVICALTGLIIVNTGAYKSGFSGFNITRQAFAEIPFGEIMLGFALLMFAFTTIIGWSYYAEKSIEYLFGRKAILPYKVVFLAMVFVGAVFSINLIWNFADITNGLMAVPNLVALLLLSGVIAAETKKYLKNNNINKHSEEKIIEQ
ncbi:MAG: sodium:alanine symporter family protein [Prevotellaceae bacterium]|jgi:AGCS family alanine or glycine:cation symporter|nr:sodium:alanine symporter family protein [Prevotellaceae bacterium]